MSSKYSDLLNLLHVSLYFSFPLALTEVAFNVLHNIGLYKARKWATLPDNLSGKTVVITGANTGIEKETVKAMVERGARVIMACRDLNRTKHALNDIVKDLGEAIRDKLTVVQLYLDDLNSVRSAAKEINSQITSLDVLINNAGVIMCPEWTTTDGYEYQFGTNHLGHFLLTHLLLDKLQAASSGARIVNVSSSIHIYGEMHFENINLTGIYSPSKSYARSKLANILFTRGLARHFPGRNINVYAVHPGLVSTELARYFPQFFLWVLSYFSKLLVISPVEGAQTSLYCAFDEAVANQTGFYYANCTRQDKLPDHSTIDQDAEKLWNLSLKYCDVQSKI